MGKSVNFFLQILYPAIPEPKTVSEITSVQSDHDIVIEPLIFEVATVIPPVGAILSNKLPIGIPPIVSSISPPKAT